MLINNSSGKSRKQLKLTRYLDVNFILSEGERLLTDPGSTAISCVPLFLLEIFLNIFITFRVNYTEIDWSTYMQQVECFLRGEMNYTKIHGDTGPIVYPAGHLYVYTVLYFITDSGKNLRIAQFIFIAIYLANLFLVFRIFSKSKRVPPYALGLMCLTSYRIHSIYALRLFNDPLAMCLLYASINLLLDRRWIPASVLFSFAIAIKMNILLFAPGLLLVFMENMPFSLILQNIITCALIQIVLGLPFLLTYPVEYIKSSFNLGRVFLFKWTVNWRFLSEYLFTNKVFHLTLLGLHLIVLGLFFTKRFWSALLSPKSFPAKPIKSASKQSWDQKVLFTLFTSNFIGICFARSLHYQFYVWYYHSLLYLLWSTAYRPVTKLCILGLIELCWNVYPSTPWSSLTLHLMHFFLIYGLWQYNQMYVPKKSGKNRSKRS